MTSTDPSDEPTESAPAEAKKKIIIETRTKTETYIEIILNVIEKRLPEEKQNAQSIYFLRNLQTKLPTPADTEQVRICFQK